MTDMCRPVMLSVGSWRRQAPGPDHSYYSWDYHHSPDQTPISGETLDCPHHQAGSPVTLQLVLTHSISQTARGEGPNNILQ